MSKEWRRYRWKCPHCDVGMMPLNSAERHLKRKHFDCLSCKAEQLLVRALIRGDGEYWVGDMVHHRTGSRA